MNIKFQVFGIVYEDKARSRAWSNSRFWSMRNDEFISLVEYFSCYGFESLSWSWADGVMRLYYEHYI